MWICLKEGAKRQWEIIGFCRLDEHVLVLKHEIGLRGRVSWEISENDIEVETNGDPCFTVTVAPDQIIPVELLRR